MANQPNSSQRSDDDSNDGGGKISPGIIETSLKHYENSSDDPDANGPSPLRCFFNALTRKKPLDGRTDTNLNRCLTLIDLTALGVGSTLGLGLYVLTGQVATTKAGPGVVISFALAAIASAFSALCYAEFAGKVPRAGSAYAYSYITVGEFIAFVIGWNLILEYVIGASSVARGFSGYLKTVYSAILGIPPYAISTNSTSPGQLLNSTAANIGGNMTSALGHESSLIESVVNHVHTYFDWLSVVIVVVLTLFILLGVKDSTNVTLAFTSVNVLVVIAVVVSSIKHLDWHNWNLSKKEANNVGEGGFLPFGWAGVIRGSSMCFFGFIGFDTIASSAEEAKNPRKNVPLSIILSLFISFLAYMAIAIVQTLLWPYNDQNSDTILPYIFDRLGMPITYWIVLLGATTGLASSQLGGMYPLPRILYSMAQDKLIYGYLAHVNRRLKLPVRATVAGSILVALLACLLDVNSLTEMVSIGTLAAYSLVSLSVLILRYEDRSDAVDDSTLLSSRLSFNDILSAESANGHKFAPISELAERGNDRATASRQVSRQMSRQTQKKAPLTAKVSTPIRTRGSRPLNPQLSVGFNSWFKSTNEDQTNGVQADGQQTDDNASAQTGGGRERTLMKLLTSWKSDEISQEDTPDEESSRLSKILIAIIVSLTIILDLIVLVFFSMESPTENKTMSPEAEHIVWRAVRTIGSSFAEPETFIQCTGYIVVVALATSVLMLSRLPTSKQSRSDAFQVPLVPLIPTLSILINTLLMFNLSYLTWVRFTVWMSIGLFIYFTYGLWNSQGYLLQLNT